MLEQQDKKDGTTAQSPTRVDSPARPGNAGATDTTTNAVKQRASHQHPGTSSSYSPERRVRPDLVGGMSVGAKQRAALGEVSRDDMIVTRGEYKGGLSGMLDPRRQATSRQVVNGSGGGNAFRFAWTCAVRQEHAESINARIDYLAGARKRAHTDCS